MNPAWRWLAFYLAVVAAGFAVGMAVTRAGAEPLPTVRTGKRCPVGYTDRDGVCIPMLGQRCRVMPKRFTCPVGWATSAEHYCIETNCR